MKKNPPILASLLLPAAAFLTHSACAEPFRAGAAKMDITPETLPVIVNGGFLSKTATAVQDPLSVRWLVLDDGATRLALGIMDTCVIPAEFADAVKASAAPQVGIPASRIMLAATHTHSAPSLMRCLGTDADPVYPAFALPRVVEGLKRAVANLGPARIGWAVTPAPRHTHTRIWIRRPDRILADPFGEMTVRANMHPGYQSPDVVGPSGPPDTALTLLALQDLSGKPLAVLANYSMHYFGAPPVSADYFALFAEKLGVLLEAGPEFVGIMSQGTSGDQHWMDYSQPKRSLTMAAYAEELAGLAAAAYRGIRFQDAVPLAMSEQVLQLATRQPDERRLAWAMTLVSKMEGRPPQDRSEVYAREQLWLKDNPVRQVRIQAVRAGDFGIAIWPCEVFAISGLKIKAQSPLQPTMNIELANAEEGYIPPPELYPLGGYNTWPCRSAGLEREAEPKIVSALLRLLEEVSGKPARVLPVTHGGYAQAVLAAQPFAYWRLEEWSGAQALDSSPAGRAASYEPGIARWLDGPPSPAFSGRGVINRCPHFAGSRLHASAEGLGNSHSVELWLWNGLPADARPLTGWLFSRGPAGSSTAPSDLLGIEGSRSPQSQGRLILAADGSSTPALTGSTPLGLRQWHHVVFVRDQDQVALYLDGQREGLARMASVPRPGASSIFLGGAPDGSASLEGKLDEIALYSRALSPEEIAAHFQAASLPRATPSLQAPGS